MKKINLRTPKPRRPLLLTDQLDRAHKRVAKLERELNKARRRLERARVRLSVVRQFVTAEARRNLAAQ